MITYFKLHNKFVIIFYWIAVHWSLFEHKDAIISKWRNQAILSCCFLIINAVRKWKYTYYRCLGNTKYINTQKKMYDNIKTNRFNLSRRSCVLTVSRVDPINNFTYVLRFFTYIYWGTSIMQAWAVKRSRTRVR